MEMELPEGVGPHEGREFELMRAGKKNVALFSEVAPEGLEDMVAEGFNLLTFCDVLPDGIRIFTWILFREGYEADAMRLKKLRQRPTKGFEPETEHEIGRILSYRREEVEAFLHHVQTI